MESENPDDHQRVEDRKRKKKQESDRKYREKKKKTQESIKAQLKTVINECRHYKAQVEFFGKSTKKLFLEPGESSGHARDAVEKQNDLLNRACWDLLKTPLPGGGTCGGTSASTDKDAYPPLELSVAAMKSDGSVTTESFKPCQSLPEEWTQLAKGEHGRLIRAFFGLREHYTATTARHALEIAKRDHELAQEIAKRDHELKRSRWFFLCWRRRKWCPMMVGTSARRGWSIVAAAVSATAASPKADAVTKGQRGPSTMEDKTQVLMGVVLGGRLAANVG